MEIFKELDELESMFNEVFQTLKDLYDGTSDVERYFSKDAESVFEKAKDVIAKFEQVKS